MAETLPGFDVEPTEPDEEEPQSGLGRGLAAIIPTLATDLDDAPAPRRRRRRGGVAALLGAPAEPEAEEASAPVSEEPAVADPAPARPAPPPGDPGPATADVPELTGEAAGEAPRPEPAPAVAHVPAPSSVRQLRDDLVAALLDGLANTMALDLCAYLHAGPGESPRLFLQSPSLDAIGSARAYDLIDGLRVRLGDGTECLDLAVAGFRGVSVTTLGEGARGLWAVARTEGISAAEVEVADRFCRSFGRAVHQLDGAALPSTTLARPLAVEAHHARDSVLAEVEVRVGDQIRPGHGRAATRVEAITRAVLAATDRPVTFRYASEVAHAGEHAAVVLLEGGDHAVALGSALSPEPGGIATAQAALRALDGLAA